jgi:hypothetical protein
VRFEPIFQVDVEAVREQVPTSKSLRVGEEVLEIKANGGIVRGDHGPRADAYDAIDGNTVAEQFEQHTHMRGASQAASAQNHCNSNGIMLLRHGGLFQLPVVLLPSLTGLSKTRVRSS